MKRQFFRWVKSNYQFVQKPRLKTQNVQIVIDPKTIYPRPSRSRFFTLPKIMIRLRKNPAIWPIKRNFFTEQRLYKLEQEANSNGRDLFRQRQYLKELFNSGNYRQCISRFESQPQIPQLGFNYSIENRNEDIRRIQSDPVVLETYVASLVMDGKSAKVVEKISPIIANTSGGSSGYRPQNLEIPPYYQSEPVLHNARTDLNQWQREVDRNQPNSNYSSGNQGMPKSDGSPIKVVLSEAWSWARFIRNISGKIVWGILLVTGVSVVMDQQGMLKTSKYLD
jgi:ATP-dependent metalloprotease